MMPRLCHCPMGVPEGRLAELWNPLKRLTRAGSVRLESRKQPLTGIKAAGAYSVSCDLSELAGKDMASDGFIRRYAASARKLGLRSFVDRADTSEQEGRCNAAGAAYLGGRAVAELSDSNTPLSSRHPAVPPAHRRLYTSATATTEQPGRGHQAPPTVRLPIHP